MTVVEGVAIRIRSRELGSVLDDFLTRTQPLAQRIAAARFEEFTVVNDDRDVGAVAEDVLGKLGWADPASKAEPPAP